MSRELSPRAPRRSDDVPLLTLAHLFHRKRWSILASGVLLMALVVAITMFRPRTYTSTAVFMPQMSESGLAQFSGLAAQLGVSMPMKEPSSSPAFYISLLKSRDVLRGAVSTRYTTAIGRDSAGRTLIDLYQVSGDTPAARQEAAVAKLLDEMETTTSTETGLIHLEVSTPWPSISRQVADRVLLLLTELNLHTRQTKAGMERRFLESRLAAGRVDLDVAENRLKSFLQKNREFRLSPELTFEHDRLERDVQLQQQVYEMLAQSYEKARIDEVRNTPSITIIVPPDLPANPDSRRTILKGLLGLLAGLAAAAFLVALRYSLAETFGGNARSAAGERRSPPEGRVPVTLEG
jgi:uncharacterized protein involved in exopolysaccharide biosynthesis